MVLAEGLEVVKEAEVRAVVMAAEAREAGMEEERVVVKVAAWEAVVKVSVGVEEVMGVEMEVVPEEVMVGVAKEEEKEEAMEVVMEVGTEVTCNERHSRYSPCRSHTEQLYRTTRSTSRGRRLGMRHYWQTRTNQCTTWEEARVVEAREAAMVVAALAGTCIELHSRRSRFQLSIGRGRHIVRSASLRGRLDRRYCSRIYMHWSTTWEGGGAAAKTVAVTVEALVAAKAEAEKAVEVRVEEARESVKEVILAVGMAEAVMVVAVREVVSVVAREVVAREAAATEVEAMVGAVEAKMAAVAMAVTTAAAMGVAELAVVREEEVMEAT